jgi:hypothetical protein
MGHFVTLHYGFDGDEWLRMASAGYTYLAEVAGHGQTASYAEFCAQIFDRVGVRIEPQDAALGGLLAEIAHQSRSLTAVILPAILLSTERGQPGAGFFAYAEEVGLLPRRAKQDMKLVFWAGELKAVFAAYAKPRP